MTSSTNVPPRIRQTFQQEFDKYINSLQAKSAADRGPVPENVEALRRLGNQMVGRIFEILAEKGEELGIPAATDEEGHLLRTSSSAVSEAFDLDLQRRCQQLEAAVQERDAEADRRQKALLERRVTQSLPLERQSEEEILRLRHAASFNPDEPLPEADGVDESKIADFRERFADITNHQQTAESIRKDAEKVARNNSKVEAQQSRPLPPIEQLLRSAPNPGTRASSSSAAAAVPGSMGGIDPNIMREMSSVEQMTKRLKMAREGF